MSARFRVSHFIISSSVLTAFAFGMVSSGCSTPPGPDGTVGTGGGVTGSGGGGPVGSGGAVTSSGGGGPTGSGGIVGAGGVVGSGGGASTGGGSGTGGAGAAGSGGGSGTGGGSSGLEGYNPDFKEFAGEDCVLPEPALLSSPDHSLPDPFLMSDDTRMSSVSQWACQRAWLKKKIEAYVHGAKPGRPGVVTGSVSNNSISIHVEEGGQSADFSVPINLPPNPGGPVPGMFRAHGMGVPVNVLQDKKVANMDYVHTTLEGAFNQLYGGSGVSNQIKWAWGISRAIDVLVDEAAAGNNDIIDPTALGTTGCSFAGKSAFTVGAFDERIALGIPMESGTGGLGSYRIVGDNDLGPNGGENPEQLSEVCDSDNWLEGTVCSNVDAVPADAHFMVAMYAPRGFTTLDDNRIGHLGPVAQYTAAAAGAEVFKALGLEANVGYHGGNDDDPHDHCTFYPSQEETTNNAIDAFLLKTIDPANFMEPKLKDQNDEDVEWSLDEYIEWDTPTLN